MSIEIIMLCILLIACIIMIFQIYKLYKYIWMVKINKTACYCRRSEKVCIKNNRKKKK